MQNTDNVDILLVEDNEADVVLMREALKDAKVSNCLHVARDGEEALAFLRKDKTINPDATVPGLILLDLYLPKMNGLEVLSDIKDDNNLRSIPVVMVTSSHEETDMVQAYEKRANAYVVKPVDFDQLLTVAKTIENFWLSTAKLPSGRRRSQD